MANAKQIQKMTPIVMCEISLGQYVGKMFLDVNELDFYFLGPN